MKFLFFFWIFWMEEKEIVQVKLFSVSRNSNLSVTSFPKEETRNINFLSNNFLFFFLSSPSFSPIKHKEKEITTGTISSLFFYYYYPLKNLLLLFFFLLRLYFSSFRVFTISFNYFREFIHFNQMRKVNTFSTVTGRWHQRI